MKWGLPFEWKVAPLCAWLGPLEVASSRGGLKSPVCSLLLLLERKGDTAGHSVGESLGS